MHSCDNPPCCNPAHLLLGTTKTNNFDCVGKRRHAHGVKHPQARLTEEQARYAKYQAESTPEAAAALGISYRQLRYVKAGKYWRHL